MLDFKIIEEVMPNKEVINALNNSLFRVVPGKLKQLLNTNLTYVVPTMYIVVSPVTLTILEYISYNNLKLPNLIIKEINNNPLNKYGSLRLEYLKNHKKYEYFALLMERKLQ